VPVLGHLTGQPASADRYRRAPLGAVPDVAGPFGGGGWGEDAVPFGVDAWGDGAVLFAGGEADSGAASFSADALRIGNSI